MDKIDIEQIPALFAEGKITAKEGAYIIWEDVYCNPHKYGIGAMSEDDKSEFLMFLLQKFEQMVADFIPGKARFRTYICGLLRIVYINWVRRKITAATENALTRHMLKDAYDGEPQYEPLEATADEERRIFKKRFHGEKKREIAKNTALVLTLKTCHEIDETILKNVSTFLRIDQTALQTMVDKLKKQSDYKAVQREHIIRRRDNAFYYHRKYMIELRKLQKGTTSFEQVQRKYQKQTETWIRQNKLLAHRYVLSPTNASIAKEIDMEPRKVSFYISRAVRKQNPFITEDDDTETEETSPDQET